MHKPDRTEVAPGVFRRIVQSRAVYSGAEDDLQACGLVTADVLPGNPGNPRGMVTLDHHGERVRKGDSSRPEPGHTRIVRVKGKGGSFFEVWVLLSEQRLASIAAERQRAAGWPFPAQEGMPASLCSVAGGTVARLWGGASATEPRHEPGVPAAIPRPRVGVSAGIGRRAAVAGAGA